MSTVHGTYQGGQIVLATAPDWPDGTPVRVESVRESDHLREEDWDTSPEAIAAWIAMVDQLEPVMTPEEDAAWRKARAEDKAWNLAHQAERDAKIDRLFQ